MSTNAKEKQRIYNKLRQQKKKEALLLDPEYIKRQETLKRVAEIEKIIKESRLKFGLQ